MAVFIYVVNLPKSSFGNRIIFPSIGGQAVIDTSPEDTFVVEGNDAVFTCIAEENDMILPPGNIEWRFSVPSMSSNVPSIFFNGTSTISCVENGISEY